MSGEEDTQDLINNTVDITGHGNYNADGEEDGFDDKDINYHELIYEKNNKMKDLKESNNELRALLKDLSEELTKTLDKLRIRTNKRHKPNRPKEQTLNKELENAEKQIHNYEKEISELKNKIEYGSEIKQNTKIGG